MNAKHEGKQRLNTSTNYAFAQNDRYKATKEAIFQLLACLGILSCQVHDNFLPQNEGSICA